MKPTPPRPDIRQTPEHANVVAAMVKRRRCSFADLVADTKLAAPVVSRIVNLMLGAKLIDVDSLRNQYVLVDGG